MTPSISLFLKMFPWWAVLGCAAVSCAYALQWLHGRRARALLAGLPSYPTLPFIGNVHQVFGNPQHIFNVVKDLSKKIEDHNLPFAAWIGPRPVVVVSDPEDVKAVTNAFVEKPYYYNFARVWVGDGLVTAPGSIWKRNIKKLAGTFTGSVVDGYQDVFNAQAARLVLQLKREAGGEPFDALDKHIAYTTLETICQTALCVPRITDRVVTTEYYKAFSRTFELLIQRGMNLFYHLEFIYRLTPAYRELLRCVDVLHNFSKTVMLKRLQERAEVNKNGTLCEDNCENGKTKFKPFLDILLDLSELDPTLTQQQIRSEVDTIIVGGQETVGITLFMTLLLIGSKADIQDKLYAEMTEIFGDSKRPVEKDDLSRMRYCEAVISETLRMYPPLPFVMREADRDLQLKSCTIPKGTKCGVNIWGAGRSKRAWGADAEEYRPERWLEDGQCQGYPSSFLAFSVGKRACIGKRYAMTILKTILAHCVRELVFASEADKLQFKLDVSLRAVSGHLIQVNLR